MKNTQMLLLNVLIYFHCIYSETLLQNNKTIKKKSFRKLMKIATSDVQFSFSNVIYSLIDGVAIFGEYIHWISEIQSC